MTDETPDPVFPAQLKGAAWPVMLLLWRLGPQNRQQLVGRSGWSPSAVAHALEGLVAAGLVERLHYRAWRLAAPGRDLLEPWLAADADQDGESTAASESTAAVFSARDPGPAARAENAAADLSAAKPRRRPKTEKPPGRPSAGKARRPPKAEKRPPSASAPDAPSASAPDAPSASVPATPGRPPEKPPAGLSGAASGLDHDHDVDHHVIQIDKHHHDRPPAGEIGSVAPARAGDNIDNYQYDSPPSDLARRLVALRPPFTRPERWLAEVPAERVAAWLDFLDDLPPRQRRAISNESAFIRAQVRGGDWPPSRRRPPCPTCGRAVFDTDGRCLVCAGVIHL